MILGFVGSITHFSPYVRPFHEKLYAKTAIFIWRILNYISRCQKLQNSFLKSLYSFISHFHRFFSFLPNSICVHSPSNVWVPQWPRKNEFSSHLEIYHRNYSFERFNKARANFIYILLSFCIFAYISITLFVLLFFIFLSSDIRRFICIDCDTLWIFSVL